MTRGHSTYSEKIPAYALGALEADELVLLEKHLETCKTCQAELAAYHTVRDTLGMALPPRNPSAALRRRLQKQLSPRRERNRWSWVRPFSQVALGMAVLLLIGLNLVSLLQFQSIQRQQSQLARQLQTSQIALAMLTYPGIQSLPINAGSISGTFLLDKDRNVAVLIAWNLPQLPENQTYQAWFSDAQGQRISAAIFRSDPSLPFTTVSILLPNSLSNFSSLGVTVEPAGGSIAPTGPRLFLVSF